MTCFCRKISRSRYEDGKKSIVLPFEIFHGLDQLRELHLFNLNAKHIPQHLLKDLRSLEILTITNTESEPDFAIDLSVNVFRKLTNLKRLY